MDLSFWTNVETILATVIEADPQRRAAVLDAHCAGRPDVRAEVESLLAVHLRGGDQLRPVTLAPDFAVGADGGAPIPPAPAVDRTGQTLSHYRLVAKLGAGGMGEVYEAHDTTLDRRVALKLLPAGGAVGVDRLRRFHAEARAASSLNHPNILVIHHFGDLDGRPFIVSEFVDGETVRRRLDRAALPLREAVGIARQVASALAVAHARGIVHRDIKPENLMLRSDGYVKVLDFGLAKLLAAPTSDSLVSPSATQSGILIGTPRYMSPEQAEGKGVDERSDIFSLGVVLYELTTGVGPFPGDTPLSVLSAILRDTPTPVTELNPALPPELARIVRQCLAKDRDRRYQSAKDLCMDLDELEQSLRSGPPMPALTGDARGRRVQQTPSIDAVAALPVANAGGGMDLLDGEPLSHLIPAGRLPTSEVLRPAIAIADALATAHAAGHAHRDLKPSKAAGEVAAELHAFERRGRKKFAVMMTSALVALIAIIGLVERIWRPNAGAAQATSGFRNARLIVEGDPSQTTEFFDTDPAISRDGRSVAYVVPTQTGSSLLARSLTGGQTTHIVDAYRGVIIQPRWSPDGRSLLYLVAGGVFVVPASGGTPRRVDEALDGEWMLLARFHGIPAVRGAAAWSPDGRRIAITSGGRLALVAAEGSPPQYLVRDYPYELHSCDWRPDGSWIACIASKFLPDSGRRPEGAGALVLVPATGEEPHQLTPQQPGNYAPAWSEDGRHLYFITKGANSSDIYRSKIGVDGHNMGVTERLTTGLHAGAVTVSRTDIVYSVQSAGANLWSVAITSSLSRLADARRLTSGDQWVDSVTVSGSGNSILYSTSVGESSVIELFVNGNGSEPRAPRPPDTVVPFGPPPDMSLASMFTRFRTPSPDRRYVAYVQPSNGLASPQLFVTRREETQQWSAPRAVPGGGWPVSWSPNGDFIAYSKYNGVDLYWPASVLQRRVYEPSIGNPRATAVAVSNTGSMLVLKSGDDSSDRVSFWVLPVSGGTPRLVLQGAPETDVRLAPLLAWGGQDPRILRSSGVGQTVDFAFVNGRLYFTQPERRNRAWVAQIPR